MRIKKSTVGAFFSGCFWGWVFTAIKRADAISTIEGVFMWIGGCVLIGALFGFFCDD